MKPDDAGNEAARSSKILAFFTEGVTAQEIEQQMVDSIQEYKAEKERESKKKQAEQEMDEAPADVA